MYIWILGRNDQKLVNKSIEDFIQLFHGVWL